MRGRVLWLEEGVAHGQRKRRRVRGRSDQRESRSHAPRTKGRHQMKIAMRYERRAKHYSTWLALASWSNSRRITNAPGPTLKRSCSLTRKRKQVYQSVDHRLTITHSTVVDLVPLYPSSVQARFPFLHQIRQYYIDTYADRFFTSPPGWFGLYAWMEAVVHLPVSLWAIPAILRGESFA